MTSLAGGERVCKDDLRVEAYGTIDELISFIGLLASMTEQMQFDTIQRNLFKIGGYLAYQNGCDSGILSRDIAELEKCIDEVYQHLPPLKRFVIPGGTTEASICHVCRTICRRAERRIVSLQRNVNKDLDANIFRYINRLSDYMFVLARKFNMDRDVEDVLL